MFALGVNMFLNCFTQFTQKLKFCYYLLNLKLFQSHLQNTKGGHLMDILLDKFNTMAVDGDIIEHLL